MRWTLRRCSRPVPPTLIALERCCAANVAPSGPVPTSVRLVPWTAISQPSSRYDAMGSSSRSGNPCRPRKRGRFEAGGCWRVWRRQLLRWRRRSGGRDGGSGEQGGSDGEFGEDDG
eukprot:6174645-Pleurochrysis_carterae.AAC.1